MRNQLMSLMAVIMVSLSMGTLATAQDRYRVYIGTYTNGTSKGIYQCELNLADGSLSDSILAGESLSPSFLAIHPNGQHLYAVNEGNAMISAFAIESTTGKLRFLNSQPSQGDAPCHVTIDATGRNLLVANYTGGSCICIPIDGDGRLSDRSSLQQHQGKRTHGHSINMDPANRYALCCDLGLDQVRIYALDAESGRLTPHSVFNAPQGAGPRHLAWHPDGKRAFINGETDLTLIACDYDSNAGELRQRQILSTLPSDVTRRGGSTAEVVVHPSGKFVYVSNRDPYNSIAIFSVDSNSGDLQIVGHQAAGIKTPRNFAIEPSGQFMLVANQSGDNVIVFRIDQDTGELAPTSASVAVSRPVCIKFMPITQ
jgi:6-phosphogluconolactonase